MQVNSNNNSSKKDSKLYKIFNKAEEIGTKINEKTIKPIMELGTSIYDKADEIGLIPDGFDADNDIKFDIKTGPINRISIFTEEKEEKNIKNETTNELDDTTTSSDMTLNLSKNVTRQDKTRQDKFRVLNIMLR